MPVVSTDERLANLLADLDTRRRHGETPDVESIARLHPELAVELRSLWATAQFADAFVKPGSTISVPSEPLTVTPPPALGDYELLEELGRGGMGVVYKARQKSLPRTVAVKLMRDARLSEASDRARFRAEAAAAAKLSHPNVVTVHEVGEHEGQPYFVMEYVEGETLGALIRRDGRLAQRHAAKLVALVARGIDHAHEQGILHRDLKPSNILLEVVGSTAHEPGLRWNPKVTDFGLAKRLVPLTLPDWRTQTGAIVGTPGYMAPEQASARRDLTAATDVYSLGAILYELLTSRPPFQAAHPVDTLLMVLEQEPVPPRWLDPGIDRDLEMICLKCLQKPPILRYASAGALADELEAFLAGNTLASAPSGLGYFVSRMLRETHHAPVLENWGVLWMWHSLATLVLCTLTQALAWAGVTSHGAYLALWSVGLITWGSILWKLRRRAGPVLFVERQIAHAWAAGVVASIAMFVIEVSAGLPALVLSPAIAVAAGMVFVFKAGILTGQFYVTAACLFLTAGLMPFSPEYGILGFGVVLAMCFYFPGLKYYRRRRSAKALT